jgi:hypothetical protein
MARGINVANQTPPVSSNVQERTYAVDNDGGFSLMTKPDWKILYIERGVVP